jgi:hypothetical protein
LSYLNAFDAPAVPALIGPDTIVLVSVWPHLAHSNVRCSKPSDRSETAIVIIRASQSGQCGRIGRSSGGRLSEAGMTVTGVG